jgi:HK97 family phage prohead protease
MDKETNILNTKILKYFSSEKAEINNEERSLIHYASTEDVDRDNEIVIASGIDLVNYAKNPQVLWNHNRWSDRVTTIGKSLWQKVDQKGLLCKTEFAKTDLANEVFELYSGGFLTSWSLGFMVKNWLDSNETGIRTFTKTELLEYSSVQIPANPEAVTLNFIKGLKNEELKSVYVNDYLISNFESEIKSLKDSVKQFKSEKSESIDYKTIIKEQAQVLIEEEILKMRKEVDSKFNELASEIGNIKLDKMKTQLYEQFYSQAKADLKY